MRILKKRDCDHAKKKLLQKKSAGVFKKRKISIRNGSSNE
jgi:hypothetical protein